MLHALRVGPIETEDGTAFGYLAVGDEEEGLIVPQVAKNDLDGLRRLVREAGGRKLRCEKALAKAAAKLGLDVGVPPRWTDHPRALFATVMAHGPLLEPFPPEVFGEVVRGLLGLLELEPWLKWPADLPFEVHATGAMRGQWEAALMGHLGEELGVVLYDRPGAMARLIERGEAGDTEGMKRIDCLALSLDDEPRFAAKACERAFALPGLPGLRAIRGGRPRRVKGHEVGLLAATALTLAELSPEQPSARASIFGVNVEVRAPSGPRRPHLVAVPAAPDRARVGRNDPCPCGSGKKYKKCHAREDEAADRRASVAPEHALDGELVADMLAWAAQELGAPALREAFAALPPGCVEREAMFCTSWILYEHPIDGQPIAARYLEALGTALGRDARDWIEAQLRARLSLWEVLSIRPGVLEMRDLFSGETREVHDQGAASSLLPRLVLLGRVVESAGRALLGTAHTRPLAPLDADPVVRSIGRKRGPRTGAKLIGAWEGAVEGLARRPPPRLTNTDGEPLLWTIDHFVIEKDAVDTVVKALAVLTDGDPPEVNGDERRFTITKPGNRMHASWDNTVIGTLTFAGTSLRAESNSVRRADALRRSIAACCGRLVQHRARTHTDPMARLGEAPRERRPEPPHPPEVLTALREMKARHMKSWLDEPIPALGGMTPREAARGKKSREKLDLLLRDMESWEARQPADERFDVRPLRAELGMDR